MTWSAWELSRHRPLAERIDFWAATEAGGIRRAGGQDDSALAAAHYTEYLLDPGCAPLERYIRE